MPNPELRSKDDALDWTPGGPRSFRFDDIYFSADDGLAETRLVFLQGCGLPQAWAGRTSFVVGELGFGTGLNILALLDLWRRTRPADAQLHIFSVEAFPLARTDAERALSVWPDLAESTSLLLESWPDDRRGFHRIDFPLLNARLDLWIGEVAEGLRSWDGRADTWFLDGFAPSRNPEMWRQEVLDLLAEHSVPEARAATFTVAGAVRRGLEQAGFTLERKPGFGAKRERLEAQLPARAEPRLGRPSPPHRVAIMGAGVAGAALARALRRLGCDPTMVESARPGAGASGNPAALVTPRLDAGLGPVAALYAQAFSRAVDLFQAEAPDAIVAEGSLQLEAAPKDAGRFDRIVGWPGFATGAVERLSSIGASARLAQPGSPGGVWFRGALVLAPEVVLGRWLGGASLLTAHVATLEREGSTWRLLGDGGEVVAEAETVVLACGADTARLAAAAGGSLPLQTVRGQVSWTRAVTFDGCAASWGGYAIPLPRGGVLFGATHDRDDTKVEVRHVDEAHSLSLLTQGRPVLAAQVERSLADSPLHSRASLRVSAPDYLPLAGEVGGAPGLFVLSGLGGRGFTLAPLLAEHVAAQMLDHLPSPLPRALAAAVDPQRFHRRRAHGVTEPSATLRR